MFNLWLVWKQLSGGKRLLNLTSLMCILGMAIGVASLVVAMAVVSGYQTTLRQTIVDLVGHVMIYRSGGITEYDEFRKNLQDQTPELKAMTPFLTLEAILAHNKMISGILIEGVDPSSVHDVLTMKTRLTDGTFQLGTIEGRSGIVIGKGVAEKFRVKVGDEVRLVIPLSGELRKDQFRPRLKRFRVAGVLDLGRHDYNERYVIMDLQQAQDFGRMGDRVTGVRLQLTDVNLAEAVRSRLSGIYGYPYRVRYWFDINPNLFRAAKWEKAVIFSVLLIMVIAACFNITSTLFVSVMRRFHEISILKTMGANRRFILKMFTRQGLFVGFVGCILGLILGFGACFAFIWAQKHLGILPGEVYKLDHIDLEIRWFDMWVIMGASLLICFLATLAPARRGANLLPVEGIRYE